MKIKMLETRIATQDGHSVDEYRKGEIYDVRQWLAHEFFKQKVAVLFNDSLGVKYSGECRDW